MLALFPTGVLVTLTLFTTGVVVGMGTLIKKYFVRMFIYCQAQFQLTS